MITSNTYDDAPGAPEGVRRVDVDLGNDRVLVVESKASLPNSLRDRL